MMRHPFSRVPEVRACVATVLASEGPEEDR